MKVIIQKDVLQRGKQYFEQSALEFLAFGIDEEKAMIEAHKKMEACCFIIGADRYSDAFFASIQPNSLVIRFGVGYDNVPVDLCRQRSILVAYTPGTLDDSVAEHTMALLLSSVRGIPRADSLFRKGDWSISGGLELRGKTLAIIGLGRIGERTAKIAKQGFGMRIAAFEKSPTLDKRFDGVVDSHSSVFSDVVAEADFVSLHLSVNPETMMFIDAEKLKLMPRRAILINTGRGQLINETDLYDALWSKSIAGAALDVFYHEPYQPVAGKDLRTLDNVVFTPHVASNTDSANRRMSEWCVRNAMNFYTNKLSELILIPELQDRLCRQCELPLG